VIQAPAYERGSMVSDRAIAHGSGMRGIVGWLRPKGHRPEDNDRAHEQGKGKSQEGTSEEEQRVATGQGNGSLGRDSRVVIGKVALGSWEVHRGRRIDRGREGP